jgi:hypothetical protein
MPFPPLEPELEELEPDEPEVPPREPALTDPALRLAVDDEVLGTELMLLPADAALTPPATVAALDVAALARALASAAALFEAATPPPVPDAWPETEVRAACKAVLRASACEDATVDGVEPGERVVGE